MRRRPRGCGCSGGTHAHSSNCVNDVAEHAHTQQGDNAEEGVRSSRGSTCGMAGVDNGRDILDQRGRGGRGERGERGERGGEGREGAAEVWQEKECKRGR